MDSNNDNALDRLLRSAAQAGKKEEPASAPFGFDTRVVAQWRAGGNGNGNGVARLLRRVAIVAAMVIVVSTAGAVREFVQTRESINEPLMNEFAIADSAIQSEF